MNKVKGEDSIPLLELEAASVHKGYKNAPLDMKLLSSLAETSLYVWTRDGKKRAFRFLLIAGLKKKEVAISLLHGVTAGALRQVGKEAATPGSQVSRPDRRRDTPSPDR